MVYYPSIHPFLLLADIHVLYVGETLIVLFRELNSLSVKDVLLLQITLNCKFVLLVTAVMVDLVRFC